MIFAGLFALIWCDESTYLTIDNSTLAQISGCVIMAWFIQYSLIHRIPNMHHWCPHFVAMFGGLLPDSAPLTVAYYEL